MRFKTVQESWLYHSIQEIQPFITVRFNASHGWPPTADRRTGAKDRKNGLNKVAILIHVICFMWGWPKEELYR